MHLEPNPSQTTPFCKIKRVYPAFRSVSTLRPTKDLPVVGPVNPEAALGMTEGVEQLLRSIHSEAA